jgi:ABC-type multidrug transport system ATPase subunit
VEQFDTLLPELTVREMLLYTAELKCPREEPLAAKAERVSQLLEVLALGACAGTHIGDSMARGISGGQVRARACCLIRQSPLARFAGHALACQVCCACQMPMSYV